MKISLKEVKQKCQRDNAELNNKLHWFSSNFSIYFSYLFIRLNLKADAVTFIFFLVGLIGVYFYSLSSVSYGVLGYFLYRLHIIIDMSDGDVARFNKSFSIRGSYWDSMIHSTLNPLYGISISFALYKFYSDDIFLLLSPFLALIISTTISVKNNFIKALYQNKDKISNNNKKRHLKNKLYFFISELLSIEGLVLIPIISMIVNNKLFTLLSILLYGFFNVSIILVKFYMYSYKGNTYSKT